MFSLTRSKFISLLGGPPRILRIARDWYFRQATRLAAFASVGERADAQEGMRASHHLG